ncbi:hypothetical protein OROMI_008630 [Orobanche minor]
MMHGRWVIPYNPYLLAKFDCHLNVEICSDIKLFKYLYKYVCKGTDKIKYSVVRDPIGDSVDEIKDFQTARWLCAPESLWRIYGFTLNGIYPPVLQLHVHLEDKQPVWFPADSVLEYVIRNPKVAKTQLTEFFEKNASSQSARSLNLLYREFPEHFVWDEEHKLWAPRSRRPNVGRLVTVNPLEGERYYLRVLLNHVRAPTSFQFLRTFNNVVYETFRDAALARGLLQLDSDIHDTLEGACGYQMPYVLRRLFATILIHNSPADPKILWEEFRDYLSDDFQKDNASDVEIAYKLSLESIDLFLQSNGRSINEFSIVPYNIGASKEEIYARDYRNELEIQVSESDLHSTRQLNDCQQVAFDEITAAINTGVGGAFFIDGPGGTGKTFLYRALLASVRSRKQIALAVASSGVAASLLPGGRTAHSRFNFPLEIDEIMSCEISKQSTRAKLIVSAKLILWDEASVAHRKIKP